MEKSEEENLLDNLLDNTKHILSREIKHNTKCEINGTIMRYDMMCNDEDYCKCIKYTAFRYIGTSKTYYVNGTIFVAKENLHFFQEITR